MGFLGQAFDIDGLLGIVAQYAGAFALCAYESTTSGALRAFVHASSNPEQAPWYVAVCQRGLKVDIQETCSGAEVHHRLKHFYGALPLFVHQQIGIGRYMGLRAQSDWSSLSRASVKHVTQKCSRKTFLNLLLILKKSVLWLPVIQQLVLCCRRLILDNTTETSTQYLASALWN